MKKMELGQALRAALLAALTAVLAQVQLPIGPVPFNLAVLGAFLAGMLLRPAWAACAMGVYMALGLIGIPVFAGFVGGPAVLAGKTGGYVLGYVCIAWCTAMARRFGRLWLTAAGMALGLVLCYALGTAWFMGMTGTGLGPSLAFCVWPFVVPDICPCRGHGRGKAAFARRRALTAARPCGQKCRHRPPAAQCRRGPAFLCCRPACRRGCARAGARGGRCAAPKCPAGVRRPNAPLPRPVFALFTQT